MSTRCLGAKSNACTVNPCGIGRCRVSGTSSHTCSCPRNTFSGISPITKKLTCLLGPCYYNPCGVGKCSSTSGSSYMCKCPSRYYLITINGASTCAPGPCITNPCGPGRCLEVDAKKYTCKCNLSYVQGINTATSAVTCVPGPCFYSPCHPGTCNPKSNGGYTCTCPTGYFRNIDNVNNISACVAGPCLSNPCGVGTCKNVNASAYTCKCPSGYSNQKGGPCILGPCSTNPCGLGTCQQSGSTWRYGCKCAKGYISSSLLGKVTCLPRFKKFLNYSGGLDPPKYQSQLSLNPLFSHLSAGYNQTSKWSIKSQWSWNSIPGVVQPVRDQGNCKSCVAFAVSASLSSALFLSNPGKYSSYSSLSSSAQQFLDCGVINCGGGWLGDGFDYVSRNLLVPEAIYPYSGISDPSDCNSWTLAQGLIGERMYEQVRYPGTLGLLLAVQQQPVTVMVESRSDAFLSYEQGIFQDPNCYLNGLDHAMLLVGYNLLSTPPCWILQNSWGSGWGENGTMRLAISDGDGICGINVQPGFYPVIRKLQFSDPCGLKSYGSTRGILQGSLNPCGGGRCRTVGKTSRYNCTCNPPFVVGVNMDGTETCVPASPCTFSTSNPCGVGTCIDSQTRAGNYTCLCSIGYALTQNADDGRPTCIPAALAKSGVTYTVPPDYEVTCNLVYTLYGITVASFLAANPKVNCNLPLPAGTVLIVTNNLGNCSVPYAVNQDDTCDSISAMFRLELNGTRVFGPESPNPDIDCQNLQPGQLICLERGYQGPDNSICTLPYYFQSTDTCSSVIANYFGGSAFSFFVLNPGFYCGRVGLKIPGIGVSTTQVCLQALPLGTVVGTCTTKVTYTVKAGDTCFRIYSKVYHGLPSLFTKLNKLPCNNKLLKIGVKLCAPIK